MTRDALTQPEIGSCASICTRPRRWLAGVSAQFAEKSSRAIPIASALLRLPRAGALSVGSQLDAPFATALKIVHLDDIFSAQV